MKASNRNDTKNVYKIMEEKKKFQTFSYSNVLFYIKTLTTFND